MPRPEDALEGSPWRNEKDWGWVTREPLLCCGLEGFAASGTSPAPQTPAPALGAEGAEPAADQQLPAGTRAGRRLPLSLLVEQPGPLGVEAAGNYLSAPSVPHNWLFFANSLLEWERTKSLEGASSHHKRLPKIKRPSPHGRSN